MESPARGPLRPDVVAHALSDAYERRILAACIRAAKAVKGVGRLPHAWDALRVQVGR